MEDARIANVRNTVAGPNAISRFTFNREAEIDDKLAPVSIGALMVRQKQGDAWKLLHDKGSRVGGFQPVRRLGWRRSNENPGLFPECRPDEAE